jgi:predicted aldo/keto reductase-like oxidoreductase
MGIRYFDTAEKYGNGKDETHIAEFLTRHPELRSELFLVSKDYPRRGPEQLLEQIDGRLARCNTKYLDLFFIHQLCEKVYGADSVNWPKSDNFKRVADQLKSSGKCKMVGFSCHGGPEYIQAAADGGFVDAVMVQYTPFYERGGAFDHALTACHEKGIGIIAMKTLRHAGEVPKRLPEFDQLGLTTHQALLHAVWSDPRISAICNSMHSVDQMESSVAAARSYKTPLKTAQINLLHEIVLAGRRTFCPGCPACHQAAGEAEFAFQDIARFVTYYEQDGWLEAREQYRALPPSARNAAGVNLAALKAGCAFGIDYSEITKRAERYFA